jgi:hypothetical protein
MTREDRHSCLSHARPASEHSLFGIAAKSAEGRVMTFEEVVGLPAWAEVEKRFSKE